MSVRAPDTAAAAAAGTTGVAAAQTDSKRRKEVNQEQTQLESLLVERL
jgi:hypothetical protein